MLSVRYLVLIATSTLLFLEYRLIAYPKTTPVGRKSGPHVSGESDFNQVPRPCRVLALAGDAWPEHVIAADLLHEELGAGGVHLVAEASHPIRMRAGFLNRQGELCSCCRQRTRRDSLDRRRAALVAGGSRERIVRPGDH